MKERLKYFFFNSSVSSPSLGLSNYSEWRPHNRSILSPMAVHRKESPLTLHAGPSAGAHVGLEGELVHGGSTPGCQWAAESEQVPHDRNVLSPTGSSPG
jgi:hypothetical protein